ncbi:MAG TPA: hypothetical protein VGS58_00030, partial [Candidatus Sulfopaludibacter sp.]|nr:hypothetical protein [Candidatus Sulfopaludibacter sp.]
ALLYSTLLDGLRPNSIAVDASGSAVIVGAATTGAVPVTANAYQPAPPGPCTRTLSGHDLPGSQVQISTHAFAAKLDAGASAFLYATYLSGSCGDSANDVALDSAGNAWIGGLTYSPDFPITPGALTATLPTTYNAGFISQLGPAGDRLVYSTFVGGGVEGTVNALALDPQGNAIAAGESTVQPTPGAYTGASSGCPPILGFFGTYSPNDHGFVMKINPASATPVFAATLGGACLDYIAGMNLDPSGNIWVTGRTSSSNFPTIAPLPNLGAPGGQPGFLAALDPSGANLISSSISEGLGYVASGPAGMLYFTEPVEQAGKNGYAILVARIDANQRAAILLDSIGYFGSGPPLAPVYVSSAVVAPGQAVRLHGRGIGPPAEVDATSAPAHVLPSLAGVQVTFNGISAQLVSVQASQIVCFVPFGLAGASSATIQVAYASQTSNPFSVSVAPQNIDVFAVANPDGTTNSQSNPAPINGVVALYLTGAGQTDPPSVDGALNTAPNVSPLSSPRITVNGAAEQPVFFGAAVGQVAGVMQVNLFVPDPGAAANDAVYIGSTFLRIWAK